MNIENAPILLQFAAIVLLLFANGFFVAAEFALVSVRRTRVEELIAKGNRTALTVKKVIHDPDRFIAATQLGITMASLGLGWIAEPVLAHSMEPLFAFLPATWVAPSTHAVSASALAFALITFMHVVIGELAPKSVALGYPEQTALWIARPTLIFEGIFRPFIWVLNGTGNSLLKLIGLHRPAGHQLVHSVEELKMLVIASMESGELDVREKEMIHNVFEVGDLTAREIMTPRPEIIAVAENTTIADFLQTFVSSTHSRFPVFSNSIDNLIGFVTVKDVLHVLATQGPSAREHQISTLVRPAIIVPESKRIGNLFVDMQTQNVQLAVIIDEFGGTAGMVTLKKILEEIVGRIGDELAHKEPPIKTIDDKTVEFDAMMRVEEVNEQLGLGLRTRDDYETVSGYILYTVRHVPKQGDHFKVGSLNFKIVRMDGPKIERVSVTRL